MFCIHILEIKTIAFIYMLGAECGPIRNKFQYLEKDRKPMACGLEQVGQPKFPGVDGRCAKTEFILMRFLFGSFRFIEWKRNEQPPEGKGLESLKTTPCPNIQ